MVLGRDWGGLLKIISLRGKWKYFVVMEAITSLFTVSVIVNLPFYQPSVTSLYLKYNFLTKLFDAGRPTCCLTVPVIYFPFLFWTKVSRTFSVFIMFFYCSDINMQQHCLTYSIKYWWMNSIIIIAFQMKHCSYSLTRSLIVLASKVFLIERNVV